MGHRCGRIGDHLVVVDETPHRHLTYRYRSQALEGATWIVDPYRVLYLFSSFLSCDSKTEARFPDPHREG